MRRTIIRCDNCDTIISDTAVSGGTGTLTNEESQEWGLYHDGKDIVDVAFCGKMCIKEWVSENL